MHILALAAIALTSSITCHGAESGAIMVDGILDDWDDVQGEELSGSDIVRGRQNIRGRYDLKVEVKCVYNRTEGMFLLVKVTDSTLIRDRRPGRRDDRVAITLGQGRHGKKMVFYPPTARKKARWKVPRKVKAKVVRLRLGYAVELGIPWGVGKIFASLPKYPVGVAVYDTDSHLHMKPETVVAIDGQTPPRTGWLIPEGANQLYEGAITKLGIQEVRMDRLGNFVPGKAPERMVWGDNYLLVMGGDLGMNFLYVTMAQSPEDVKKVRVMDLDGDGLLEVFTRVRLSGGMLEAVVVWKPALRGIRRMFAHLTEFHKGPHFIVNSYKLKAVGHGRHKHYKIIFRFDKASSSITRKNWKGQPPDETTVNFLMPWDARKEVFVFSNGSYYGGRQ